MGFYTREINVGCDGSKIIRVQRGTLKQRYAAAFAVPATALTRTLGPQREVLLAAVLVESVLAARCEGFVPAVDASKRNLHKHLPNAWAGQRELNDFGDLAN